ncbi:MAG TPA: cytochrome d ubiquinol oxidase subunit II [Acidimicrobiales bacterium]|nr:cytochrome d ubiquinol oxidase subunit II [Acidimicrobiales bacterium]
MTLADLWYILIVILWVGFFILEGFDFGVGMLHSFIGRTDPERRVLINTIGPVWDGNEVWLIVAGAGLFAAFPAWYATMFSALYLAMVLVLVALILRGLTFEWQRKFDDPRWRRFWRWGLTIGSALIPFLIGVALGDLLHGLPINKDHQYTGGFWQLLTPFGLWTGVTLTVLSLLSGATYLGLKTTGELHDRVHRFATVIGVVAVVVAFGFYTWLHVGLSTGFVPEPLEALALLGVIVAAWAARERAEGWAFMAACVGIGGTVGSLFTELYPRVMISSTNSAYNLTVANSASPTYSLRVMTVAAAIFFPAVLLYQGWTYRVFRRRLSVPRVGGDGAVGNESDHAATAQPERPEQPEQPEQPKRPGRMERRETQET